MPQGNSSTPSAEAVTSRFSETRQGAYASISRDGDRKKLSTRI